MTSTLQRSSTWGVRALTLLSLGCLAVVMAAQRLQPNKSAAARLAPPQEPTPIPTRARLLLAVEKPPPLQPDFHQQLPHNLSWLFKNRAPRIYLEQVATMHEQPQALVDWAEVPGGAAQRFCGCFSKPGAQVALVGNGPLSPEQREAIAEATCIIRFNWMQGRVKGERTDIWVVRASGSCPQFYFLENAADTVEVARSVSAVVFAAHWDVEADIDRSMRTAGNLAGLRTPEERSKLVALNLNQIDKFYNNTAMRLGYMKQSFWPSTGISGVLAVLSCLPPDGVLHVFGFNWSGQNWGGHLMQMESSLIQLLVQERRGGIVLHPTPCGGYRTCS